MTAGKLEDIGGRWRLRFTRELAHPQEKVWRAITEPEHMRAWFPQHVSGDWVVGGPLTFSGPEGRRCSPTSRSRWSSSAGAPM